MPSLQGDGKKGRQKTDDISSPIQTITVGTRITLAQPVGSRTITADQGITPCPEVLNSASLYIESQSMSTIDLMIAFL
jgi:hypothetical protein